MRRAFLASPCLCRRTSSSPPWGQWEGQRRSRAVVPRPMRRARWPKTTPCHLAWTQRHASAKCSSRRARAKQIVVAVPSQHCNAGQLLNVYDRSRAGSWYALFTQPVCGTSIAVGPKSPYGDNMITIDGRSFIDKAGEFVPFK